MLLTAVVLLATTVGPAQSRALLDVPYVAQTPELCGGAAVSMVMRYWGARDVIPEDFATLVVPSERGIPTTSLTTAVRARQWQVVPGPEGAVAAWESLERDVARGRPVITLIEVAPQTFHYVVVVGLTDSQIVVHDPARAPFRVQDRASFDRAWTVAGRWSVVLLPPASGSVAPASPPAAVSASEVTPSTPCGRLVTRGVDLALAGQLVDAEAALLAATALCPDLGAGWRELAGLRFAEQRWTEAARLAERAVGRDPADTHAVQILATSRFLAGDAPGALRAWNTVGEPGIDTITVVGASRLSHPDVIAVSGLVARRLLTADMLGLASRRVSAIPSVARARVSFSPEADASAAVTLALVERDVLPRGWIPLGLTAGRALIEDQVRVDLYGALRRGERIGGAWRWRPQRRRVVVGAAFPAPAWLPGVVAVDAQWERQTYVGGVQETRRRLTVTVSDWATPHLRWRAGAGTDQFDGGRRAAVELGAEVRMAGDRLALGVTTQRWLGLGDASGFGAIGGFAALRSTVETARPVWHLSTSFDDVGRGAPRAVWPGAGSGGRGALLRAHPLIVDDVVAGPVLGRRVWSATAEFWMPVTDVLGQRFLVAVFTDAAQAWLHARPERGRLYIDAGAGLRVATLGGTVRIDVAHGVRGGRTTWSAGWITTWPRGF